MANATLYSTFVITPTKSGIVPSTGEVTDGIWCRQIAAQQIRCLGYRGVATIWVKPEERINVAASISLPFNAFGTMRPPMVYVMPQYDNEVWYWQFEDASLVMMENIGQIAAIRTYVDDLHKDNDTVGGVAGFRWSFTIRHGFQGFNSYKVGFPPAVGVAGACWVSPWKSYRLAQWPQHPEGGNIYLHWYALGVDTSKQI